MTTPLSLLFTSNSLDYKVPLVPPVPTPRPGPHNCSLTSGSLLPFLASFWRVRRHLFSSPACGAVARLASRGTRRPHAIWRRGPRPSVSIFCPPPPPPLGQGRVPIQPRRVSAASQFFFSHECSFLFCFTTIHHPAVHTIEDSFLAIAFAYYTRNRSTSPAPRRVSEPRLVRLPTIPSRPASQNEHATHTQTRQSRRLRKELETFFFFFRF